MAYRSIYSIVGIIIINCTITGFKKDKILQRHRNAQSKNLYHMWWRNLIDTNGDNRLIQTMARSLNTCQEGNHGNSLSKPTLGQVLLGTFTYVLAIMVYMYMNRIHIYIWLIYQLGIYRYIYPNFAHLIKY